MSVTVDQIASPQQSTPGVFRERCLLATLGDGLRATSEATSVSWKLWQSSTLRRGDWSFLGIWLCLENHSYAQLHIYRPVLKINNHATGGWRTKDILRGPKSLETKKLGSSKGWEDQSAEKTNNWKDKKYITNRWDTKKLNILLKTETTVHFEIIHLWRGNLVCMCSYPC